MRPTWFDYCKEFLVDNLPELTNVTRTIDPALQAVFPEKLVYEPHTIVLLKRNVLNPTWAFMERFYLKEERKARIVNQNATMSEAESLVVKELRNHIFQESFPPNILYSHSYL